MRKNKPFVWLSVFSVLVLGYVLINTVSVGASRLGQTAPDSIKGMQADLLMDELAQADDAVVQKEIQEKLAPLEYALEIRATAQAQPPVSLAEICANRIPVVVDKAVLEMGIYPVREDFLAMENLKINNLFRGLYQDQITEVYAGNDYNEGESGLVVVSIESAGVYLYVYDPATEGTLEIVGENNLRLELRTSLGSTRWFDIPSMQFVSGPDVVMKSLVLPPTPEPFVDPCQ